MLVFKNKLSVESIFCSLLYIVFAYLYSRTVLEKLTKKNEDEQQHSRDVQSKVQNKAGLYGTVALICTACQIEVFN